MRLRRVVEEGNVAGIDVGLAPGRSISTFARRAWELPLLLHGAALVFLLLLLLPWVGTHGDFTSDEGVAVSQARLLARDGTWYTEHPLPRVAEQLPGSFPLDGAVRTEHGYAPLPKNPAYSALLAFAHVVGGHTAMVVVSLLGTVAAALLSGFLAGHLHDAVAKPTLWLVGLGSPLVFDAYVVFGHTVAAAAAAGALLLALQAWRRWSWPAVLGVVLAVASVTMLRTEGFFFAVAFGTALAISAVMARSPRLGGLAVASVAAGAIALIADSTIERELFRGGLDFSDPVSAASPLGGGTLIGGRAEALVTTVLRPAYGGGNIGGGLTLVIALLGVALALVVRRHPDDGGRLRMVAGALCVVATARLVIGGDDPDLIPGLVMAFPVLVWGAIVADRRLFRDPPARVMAGTVVIFAGAILATQYPQGGGWEWGGRYFALVLPVAAPLAVRSLHLALPRIADPVARRAVLTTAIIVTGVISVTAVTALSRNHDLSAGLAKPVHRLAATVPPGDGGRPVVVTTEAELPRLSWRTMRAERWLLVPAGDLERALAVLADSGVDAVVLATRRADHVHRELEDGPWEPAHGWPSFEGDRWWMDRLDRP